MKEMTSKILIHRLNPKNILSFGTGFAGIDLKSLNVLIGPNGSGKSFHAASLEAWI